MQIINTYAGATLAIMDDAEQAAWEAANPAVGDFLINSESKKIVYLDEAGDIQEVFLSGDTPTSYTVYEKGYTGSDYTNTDLIGATAILFFMDGNPRFQVVSAPDPSKDYTFDTATGTIAIGTNFADNDIMFMYSSLIPPSV